MKCYLIHLWYIFAFMGRLKRLFTKLLLARGRLEKKVRPGLQLGDYKPRPSPIKKINTKPLKSLLTGDGCWSMRCCSISSPNLSSIPQTFTEKIDAEIMNVAFSTWSVLNSATKGIRSMQTVSSLPISAWLYFQPRWAAAGSCCTDW